MSHLKRGFLVARGLVFGVIWALVGAHQASAVDVCDFSKLAPTLAYADWKGCVRQERGFASVRAQGRGGLLIVKSMNLSPMKEDVLAISVRVDPANQDPSLQVRLIDSNGNQGVWDFNIAGLPRGQEVTVVAARNFSLENPTRHKGILDLSRIRQCHVQGSWLSSGITAVDLVRITTDKGHIFQTGSSEQARLINISQPVVVHDFTKIGLPFGYVDWKDRGVFKSGCTAVDAPTGQGGAASGMKYDLTDHGQDTLALTVRVRDGNTLKGIVAEFVDSAKHDCKWFFDISKATPGASVRILAQDDASLDCPSEGGGLDLANITSLNINGNWSADQKVALDLLQLETVAPTQEMEALRILSAETAAEAAVSSLPPLRLMDDIQPQPRTAQSPRVTLVCLVAPDILAVTIESGKVTRGKVIDYVASPSDEIEQRDNGTTSILKRKGMEVGELLGTGAKRQVVTWASYSGDVLQTELADHADSFSILCTSDPAYQSAKHPVSVNLKSKPTDYLGGQTSLPTRHVLFLRLPSPLKEGRTYSIDCGNLNVLNPHISFVNDTRKTLSLAIHTSQIGYRADDPFKRGYLSIWLGPSTWSGADGSYQYPSGLKFRLLEDVTGTEVYSGPVEIAKRSTDLEFMFKDQNFNGTDVLRADFSTFSKPGKYRLYVDGVGCGYPFVIGQSTWVQAFRTQMRGFYNQRSGIALGPPFTKFVKPRDHHPDDGVPIIKSNWSVPIWREVGESELQQGLRRESTGDRVSNGWGGYMDAGDWNPRRVSHMRATMAQLEIADLFPEFVSKLKTNIPEDYKVPDVLNEALFEIDCYRRMQTPEGGIGYGLETVGDPSVYGVSWHTKVLPVYRAAPDPGNSWFYAGVAARAARLLKRYDAKLAAVYSHSAARAMVWAEADFARQCTATGKTAADLVWTIRDSRNLAAIEMLRLTGDKRWHDLFLENTVLTSNHPNLFMWGKAVQSDVAFAYAIADKKLTDPVLRARAIEGLEAQAKLGVTYSNGNAFDIVSNDKGRPMFMGFFSTPWGGRVALRAYHLTGKKEYLTLGLRACQFSSGANPDNLVFTTGLGANPIKNALKLDAQSTGQPVPEGITVYGIEDHVNYPSSWSYWILGEIDRVMSPKYLQWPLTESYTDTVFFIAQNEFTTDIWDESTWTWGYLAGRPVK